MPKYKLIYFKLTLGRAEPTRVIFHAAQQEFEDKLVESADWPDLKPKTPMGQLPVLEVDGRQLCQSSAINRYLAKSFGLAGKSKSEAAKCDMYVDAAMELLNSSVWEPTIKDKEERQKFFDGIFESKVVPFMDLCEKFLKKNATGYFVGKELTWADLVIYTVLGTMQKRGHDDLFANHPILAAFMQTIYQRPEIKERVDATWMNQIIKSSDVAGVPKPKIN